MLPISDLSPWALPTKPPSSNTPVHVAVLHLLSKPPFTFKTPNKQINTCPDEQSWNTKTGWQDNDQEEVKCRLWVCTGDTPSPCSSHPAGSRTHLNSSALAPSAGGAENNTPKETISAIWEKMSISSYCMVAFRLHPTPQRHQLWTQNGDKRKFFIF